MTATTAATTSMRDDFIAGLQNAHSVEAQASQIMQRQIDRMSDDPDMVSRLRSHLEETRAQQKRLEEILAGMGNSHSSFKDAVMGLQGNIMAIGHAMAGDEVVKNALENSAFEHYEAAMYQSLIAMADEVGATSAVPLLEQSLEEEKHMAAWVDSNIGEVTRTYLHRHAAEKA